MTRPHPHRLNWEQLGFLPPEEIRIDLTICLTTDDQRGRLAFSVREGSGEELVALEANHVRDLAVCPAVFGAMVCDIIRSQRDRMPPFC